MTTTNLPLKYQTSPVFRELMYKGSYIFCVEKLRRIFFRNVVVAAQRILLHCILLQEVKGPFINDVTHKNKTSG